MKVHIGMESRNLASLCLGHPAGQTSNFSGIRITNQSLTLLRMAAWSARGMFTGLSGDIALHRRKMVAAHRLFAKYDAALIVEAHSDEGCLARLAGELPSHRFFASRRWRGGGGGRGDRAPPCRAVQLAPSGDGGARTRSGHPLCGGRR